MNIQTGRTNLYEKNQTATTQASYDPKFECVERKISIGNLSMNKAVTRQRQPTGRPDEYPNLVEIKPDYAGSINPNKVEKALNKLGHLS